MSDSAQAELDSYLNQKQRYTAHPEDRRPSPSHSDPEDSENDKPSRAYTRSGSYQQSPAAQGLHDNEDDNDDDDDDSITNNMATMTMTRARRTYVVPSNAAFANTGPKGVIADAQAYARHRKAGVRQSIALLSNSLTNKATQLKNRSRAKSRSDSDSDSDSDSALDKLDLDDNSVIEFRAKQQREYQDLHPPQRQQRRTSPSGTSYGAVEAVNELGFLDAVDKTCAHVCVNLLLYEPGADADTASFHAELAFDELAEQYPYTRFIKMAWEKAEMQSMGHPSIITHKNGEVWEQLDEPEIEYLSATDLEKAMLRKRMLTV